MVSNIKLFEAFILGVRHGNSNHIKIRKNKLIGYDSLIYAKREGKKFIIYSGWKGFTKTTTSHINFLIKIFNKAKVKYKLSNERYSLIGHFPKSLKR